MQLQAIALIGNFLALLGIFIQLTRTKGALERMVHEIDKRLVAVETRMVDWIGVGDRSQQNTEGK